MRQVTADALRRILDEMSGVFRDLATGDVRATRKTDGTLVTRVDVAVDRLLRDRLLALSPDAAWLSEESAAGPARLSSRWAWVVDPLDGTKELARGVPEYAISVGLVENGGVALLVARGLVFERLDRAPVRFNQPDLRVRSGFVAGPPSLVTPLADQLRARLPRSHVGA